jgi:hypothetical protein
MPEETGAYKIVCEPGGSTVRVSSTSHRLCTYSEDAIMHFFRASGEFFFWVPSGIREFAVKVTGANLGERLKAALHDSSGTLVEEKDNIAQPHVFVVKRDDVSEGEIWSLRVSKPSEGVLEDYYVELLGVPPLVSYSREALLRPAE